MPRQENVKQKENNVNICKQKWYPLGTLNCLAKMDIKIKYNILMTLYIKTILSDSNQIPQKKANISGH